jgi:acyl-CoA synthetase (NDP forming)
MERLFRPRTVAVIGGGAWCENVVQRCRDMSFAGPIWPVHPKRASIGGVPAFVRLEDLPTAPDACFIGVNRLVTVQAVRLLSEMGAGGAVCFASGYSEAREEMADGADLQAALLAAAGDMPILGPNCYGFINYLDGALLWPDQHGGKRVDRGVAILTQSSNIAINLTMQTRGLPLAFVVTVGNQAQTGMAEIGQVLLRDQRVTALGLHIEGIGDLRAFEALAATARDLGKRIVALKAGRSEQARTAAISHTASLVGSEAGAQAFLARLGVAQVRSLTELLEALKLLHVTGPLASNRIASASCSGGEASLMADAGQGRGVEFSPLNPTQKRDLRAVLGPKVALANPLDYHTYIWGNEAAQTRAFSALMDPSLALGCLVLDFPRPDNCISDDWDAVLRAAKATQDARGVPMALVSSLPETLPEPVCEAMVAQGVAPLCGLSDAIAAIEVAALQPPAVSAPVLLPEPVEYTCVSTEEAAKSALARFGLTVPASRHVSGADVAKAAVDIGFPVVLKGVGLAHKTEAGAVALNLTSAGAVRDAADAMPGGAFLLEEMVTDGVAELLVGVVLDPAHGYVLTLAAGGVLTEVMADSVTMLLPVTPAEIEAALMRLRYAPVLTGYRGARAVDMKAVVNAVLAVQDYVIAHQGRVAEVEVNPLICTPVAAIAADALIRARE